MPMPISLFGFHQHREIGISKPSDKLQLIDHRIDTLVSSWRHAIPFNARRNAGTSAMAFDKAEDRFLLCGNSRGEVSIVDFESCTNQNPSRDNYPFNHKIIPTMGKSGHEFMINECQWYPVDTSMFVTSGMDKFLKIWDATQLLSVEQYKFTQPISTFHWIVSNKNASSLIALAMSSSNVSLLDPRIGNTAQQIRTRNERVWSVRWLNSNKYILATGSELGTLTLWDIRSGKSELKIARSPIDSNKSVSKSDENNRKSAKNLAHTNRISCLRCSTDGRFILTLNQNHNISLWDANTLKLLSWMKVSQTNPKISTVPNKFEFSDEGRSLWAFVPSGNEITLVQFPSPYQNNGQQIKTNKESNTRALHGHFQSIVSCAYRRTYQQLVTSSTDRMNLIWAPQMDEALIDSTAQNIQKLHEDAFSDED